MPAGDRRAGEGRAGDGRPRGGAAALVDDLVGVVGAAHVLVGDTAAGHEVDWTGRFRGRTPAVVRPASTEEVAGVLNVCRAHAWPVVAQGGNTGLVGGGVPLHGEVVVSLGRLTRLDPVDAPAAQVTAGAGVALARLQRHAAEAGLAFGVDLGARDTATVGGMVATNAGGLHLLRYGGMREQVLGVEAVLADGRVVSHLGGLVKDNTGYHLPSLLCGSEGTLAVVTAARVRLVPAYAHRVAALVGVSDVDTAVGMVARLRRRLPSLEAAELVLHDGIELVREVTGAALPFGGPAPVYVLVECADHEDPTGALAAAVGEAVDPIDVAVADDAVRRGALWALREGHTEAINTLGPPHKLDVTLPQHELAGFVPRVRATVASVDPSARCYLFGHLGDGNLHVNVVGPEPDDERVDAAVLELVAELGGSISAEHGIGTAKRRWLHLNRSPVEVEVFRAIKSALDPEELLNPHALLPPA